MAELVITRPHNPERWLWLRGRLHLKLAGLLAFLGLGFYLAYPALLRGIGSYLIVEDRLEPAAAIVVLGGHLPFRAIEGANLYRAGWANRLVLVRGAGREEERALRNLGVAAPGEWELSLEVLMQLGVPRSAILVPGAEADGTLEELRIAAEALNPGNSAVILVTSKVHTRRARVTWQYVTHGRSHGITRWAQQDPFDARLWWRERRFILEVVREYLGLANYWAGFPVNA